MGTKKPQDPGTEGAEPTQDAAAAPAQDPPAPGALAAPSAEPLLLTPVEWAKRLGKVGRDPGLRVNGKARPAPLSWDHAAADQLHGWTEHDQHSATPLKIRKEPYLEALKAAAKPDSTGRYVPEPHALSPYKRAL
jgi:hypothetical protein